MKRLSSAELFAVLVSVSSIAISVLGNRTQERLLAASVWPNLSFDSSNTSDDGLKQVIAISVVNSGTGPARIRNFSFEYEGRNAVSASALLKSCCDINAATVITSPIVGKVLRAGERVNLLVFPLATEIAQGWHRLDKARFGFVYSACYCSALNECWNVRSDKSDPTPVAVCSEMPRSEQWHG